MAKINDTDGEASSSQVPYELSTSDLLLIIDDLNREVGKWKSECSKKDVVINVYDMSEKTYDKKINSWEEDCVESYRIQSKLNLKVDGFKKLYTEEKLKNTELQIQIDFLKNLVLIGNILGKI